jgi:hypothetical protein
MSVSLLLQLAYIRCKWRDQFLHLFNQGYLSLSVGKGRGCAQDFLPLIVLSASSLSFLSLLLHILLKKPAHFGLAFLHSSAKNDRRQRHRQFGAVANSIDREDVIPAVVVRLKGSHMLGLHPFLHGGDSHIFN